MKNNSEDQKIQWHKCKICEKEIAGANYCTDCQEEIDTGGNVQYCVYCESERFESREWCCEECGKKFVNIQQLHKETQLLQQDIDSLRPQNRRLQDALSSSQPHKDLEHKDKQLNLYAIFMADVLDGVKPEQAYEFLNKGLDALA